MADGWSTIESDEVSVAATRAADVGLTDDHRVQY